MKKLILSVTCLFITACGNDPLDDLVSEAFPYIQCEYAAKEAKDRVMSRASKDYVEKQFSKQLKILNSIEMDILEKNIRVKVKEFKELSLEEINDVYKSEICQSLIE